MRTKTPAALSAKLPAHLLAPVPTRPRRRWLPAPLLSVALFIFWLVLNPSLAPGQIAIGVVIGLVAPILSRSVAPPPRQLHRPLTALRLIAHVTIDVVVSNLQMAWLIAINRWRKPHSGFVTIPLELRDPNGLAVLAVIVSSVPGSVWCELAPDASMLILHVLDFDDHDQYAAHFKARYERPLLEIYR